MSLPSLLHLSSYSSREEGERGDNRRREDRGSIFVELREIKEFIAIIYLFIFLFESHQLKDPRISILIRERKRKILLGLNVLFIVKKVGSGFIIKIVENRYLVFFSSLSPLSLSSRFRMEHR